MVTGASDSTPRQVEKAVTLLARADFPAARLAYPILRLDQVQEAFRVMEAREGMRVVLKP